MCVHSVFAYYTCVYECSVSLSLYFFVCTFMCVCVLSLSLSLFFVCTFMCVCIHGPSVVYLIQSFSLYFFVCTFMCVCVLSKSPSCPEFDNLCGGHIPFHTGRFVTQKLVSDSIFVCYVSKSKYGVLSSQTQKNRDRERESTPQHCDFSQIASCSAGSTIQNNYN